MIYAIRFTEHVRSNHVAGRVDERAHVYFVHTGLAPDAVTEVLQLASAYSPAPDTSSSWWRHDLVAGFDPELWTGAEEQVPFSTVPRLGLEAEAVWMAQEDPAVLVKFKERIPLGVGPAGLALLKLRTKGLV